ncbi:hypothetical protein HY498_02165 [Candidatus Woesearchaeota archaeon]|nr:hypothetical protein [Candidatus Woesearchaeota archaeon]
MKKRFRNYQIMTGVLLLLSTFLFTYTLPMWGGKVDISSANVNNITRNIDNHMLLLSQIQNQIDKIGLTKGFLTILDSLNSSEAINYESRLKTQYIFAIGMTNDGKANIAILKGKDFDKLDELLKYNFKQLIEETNLLFDKRSELEYQLDKTRKVKERLYYFTVLLQMSGLILQFIITNNKSNQDSN